MHKRVVSCLFSAIFISFALYGSFALGKIEEPSSAESKGVDREDLQLSVLLPLYVPEAPRNDLNTSSGKIWQELERLTGTKLEIRFVPDKTFNDTVNVMIASQELPKALVITDNKAPSIVNSMRAGMFWEIGPYLSRYKNLSKINKVRLANAMVDGKTYGLPRTRVLTRLGFVFRKDWLSSVGMKVPETLDDVYKVLKAFTKQDPDGNGKNDTFGLALNANNGISQIEWYITAMGGPNKWGVKDGKVLPDFMFEQNMAALDWLKQLYDEGLVNRDMAVMQGRVYDLVNQGKAGAYIENTDSIMNSHNDFIKAMQQKDPSTSLGSVMDFVHEVKSVDGFSRTPATAGFWGQFVMPKAKVKNTDELLRILAFFDRIDDKEIADMLTWGFEGVHYQISEGVPSYTVREKWLNEVSPFKQLSIVAVDYSTPGKIDPLLARIRKTQADNEKNAVPNIVEPFVSTTESTRGSGLKKIIDDARIKYVMGIIDKAGWDKAVQHWLASGGEKIIDEYNAEYAKILK